MALDDRARMSTVSLFSPVFPASVRPIGGLTAKSRQAAAWMYAGVIVGAAAPPTAGRIRDIFERFRMRKHTKYHGRHFSF